jgi:hypothetical protein
MGQAARSSECIQTQEQYDDMQNVLQNDNTRSAGAANRIRTCDPVITNDVLYQLSYCGNGS